MSHQTSERGFAAILLVAILAIVIAGAAVFAIQARQTQQTSSPSATPAASTDTDQVAIIDATKAFYKLYRNGDGTKEQSAAARTRDSQYVTASLRTYLDKADKGQLHLGVDPVLCAQNSTTAPYTYEFLKTTATAATIIARQKFEAGGTAEISIGLMKQIGAWKLDTLTCIPPQAH